MYGAAQDTPHTAATLRMIELESDAFETHSYLDGVKEMRSHSFDKYYSEYCKKYSLGN